MPKETIVSSGLKSADATISSEPCYLSAVAIYANGSTSAIAVTLYDTETSTTTNKSVLASARSRGRASLAMANIQFTKPVRATKGIRADVIGSSATYIVYYGSILKL